MENIMFIILGVAHIYALLQLGRHKRAIVNLAIGLHKVKNK